MSTLNICFYGELTKIIPHLSSDTLLICSSEIYRYRCRLQDNVSLVHETRNPTGILVIVLFGHISGWFNVFGKFFLFTVKSKKTIGH